MLQIYKKGDNHALIIHPPCSPSLTEAEFMNIPRLGVSIQFLHYCTNQFQTTFLGGGGGGYLR
jgi:hypothetical protein